MSKDGTVLPLHRLFLASATERPLNVDPRAGAASLSIRSEQVDAGGESPEASPYGGLTFLSVSRSFELLDSGRRKARLWPFGRN